MVDLSMDMEKFKEIVAPYKKRLILSDSSDLEDVFNLVHDLLSAEADAILTKEPYALRTVSDYKKAAYVVNSARFDFANAWEEVYE